MLPPLLTAGRESRVRIKGGTHNFGAPPFDFLARSFLPLLARMGAGVSLELVSYGFYPRGGGEIRARIVPAPRLGSLALTERGAWKRGYAEAYVATLPAHVAQRELEVVGRQLDWKRDQLHLRALPSDTGPGQRADADRRTRDTSPRCSPVSASGACARRMWRVRRRGRSGCLPCGVARPSVSTWPTSCCCRWRWRDGGVFVTTTATEHLRTNAAIVERFTARRVRIGSAAGGVEVTVD